MRNPTAKIALMLGMLALGGLAYSQQSEDPVIQQPGARLQELQRRMNLTPEQLQQIQPILEDEAKKVKEIRAKHADDTSRRGRRKMMRELRGVQKDAQARIEPILTPDQKSEWKKIREERRKELRERR